MVILWLLWGISEQNALTLGLHPRDTGILFGYTPTTHDITITYIETYVKHNSNAGTYYSLELLATL